MSTTSKKPLVNKTTYHDYVNQKAQLFTDCLYAIVPGRGIGDTTVADLDKLVERVASLAALFRIDSDSVTTRSKPADLNLEFNWEQYSLKKRWTESQEGYKHHAAYYARAYNEIIAITIAIAVQFQALLEPPTDTKNSYPCLKLRNRYLGTVLFAKATTAAEGYLHAQLEVLVRDYLSMFVMPYDQSRLQIDQIHELIACSVKLMQMTKTVVRNYARKSWKKA